MAQTPAHIQHVHGLDRRISVYRDEFLGVQSLYLDRRYKQCIALCEQLQRPEVHPVHQLFFWFYRAISYETIGLIAHDYSSNKLQFLYLARESFVLALTTLPLPCTSTEAGMYEQRDDSPIASVLTLRSVQHADSRTLLTSPVRTDMAEMVQSASSSSMYSIESMVSAPYTVLESDGSPLSKTATHNPTTPGGQGILNNNSPDHPGRIIATLPKTPATHKSRLSQSLSLEHDLADELVPSPLFSRKSKQAHIMEPEPDHTYSKDTAFRPLPALPFNHQPNFEVRGSRIVQVPTLRKTAVQTLIARYEGCLPLMASSPSGIIQPPSPSPSPTPTGTGTGPAHQRTSTTSTYRRTVTDSPAVTPRFKIIRDAFTVNPVNEHLETYLASPDLTCYNACLAEFGLQLRNSITYLDKEIRRVHQAQKDRSAAKALSKTRFASFWSFEHNGALSAPKKTCLESGECTTSSEVGNKTESSFRPRPASAPARERIEKLRLEGWHVRKETHGFKGQECYDNLARCVERELAVAARGNRSFGAPTN